MKHLFVPYEMALLAKETGFNELCLGWWNYKKNFAYMASVGVSNSDAKACLPDGAVAAPTHQQLVDWLRDKHGMLVHQVMGFAESHNCFKIQDGKRFVNIDTEQGGDYYSVFNAALTNAIKRIKK